MLTRSFCSGEARDPFCNSGEERSAFILICILFVSSNRPYWCKTITVIMWRNQINHLKLFVSHFMQSKSFNSSYLKWRKFLLMVSWSCWSSGICAAPFRGARNWGSGGGGGEWSLWPLLNQLGLVWWCWNKLSSRVTEEPTARCAARETVTSTQVCRQTLQRPWWTIPKPLFGTCWPRAVCAADPRQPQELLSRAGRALFVLARARSCCGTPRSWQCLWGHQQGALEPSAQHWVSTE